MSGRVVAPLLAIPWRRYPQLAVAPLLTIPWTGRECPSRSGTTITPCITLNHTSYVDTFRERKFTCVLWSVETASEMFTP